MKSFYSASLLLMFFSNLSSALNYVFQAMMARNLTTSDFGLMDALFSLMGFLSLPVVIYANVLARSWAELANASRHEEVNRFWYASLIAVGIYCLMSTFILLGTVSWFAQYLKTSNLTVVRVAIVGAALGAIFGLVNPWVMARQWFLSLALGGVMGVLLRIGIGWMGIQWHMPLSSAVLATAIYGGVLIVLIFWKTSRPTWNQLPFKKLLFSRQEYLAPILVTLSLFCISGMDTLIVRRLYDPDQQGVFAQVMKLGRIIFFLISPVALVIFPKTATSFGLSESSQGRGIVRRALLLGGIILMIAATLISVWAPFCFQLLRGYSDPTSVAYLRVAVWCLIPLSLCQLILPSLFARRQERYLLEFTLLSFLLPIGIVLFPSNLFQVFFVEGFVGILLLGFMGWRLRSAIQQ